MGRYFGTDGIRGIANTELTAELAYKLGRAAGYLFTQEMAKPKVVVGKDPRISGDMLECALMAGLLSIGVEVMRLGVITTPGVAYLTRALGAQAGVMISASHNPVEDNGIKFFGPEGFKLTDEQEAAIEALLDAPEDTLPRPIGGNVGVISPYLEGGQKYIHYLKSTVEHHFDGLHIVLDCANGAASSLAPQLFGDLGAQITTIGTSPNGVNINDGVGSTHPEALQQAVMEHNADLGLAFDGDADRLIAVDENGQIVDGDKILYICAKALKEQGRLKENTVVSTIMGNLGLHKALKEAGIQVRTTPVGDRYVLEEMLAKGLNLGGEPSGHLIFLDHNTTGDGLLSALQLVNILLEKEQRLSELADEMMVFPQMIVNVKVADKQAVLSHQAVQAKIKAVEEEMAGRGRVVVRPSGTEPVVRIMVEAEDAERLEDWAEAIADVIRRETGEK